MFFPSMSLKRVNEYMAIDSGGCLCTDRVHTLLCDLNIMFLHSPQCKMYLHYMDNESIINII